MKYVPVGLIDPESAVEAHSEFQSSVKVLKSWGFQINFGVSLNKLLNK